MMGANRFQEVWANILACIAVNGICPGPAFKFGPSVVDQIMGPETRRPRRLETDEHASG